MAKYSGFDATSFKRDLQRLGRELEGVPHALDRACHVLADEIKARCPKDSGHLASTVKVGRQTASDGRITQEVEVGEERPPDGRWYVGFVEYGSQNTPANPFIRQSINAKEAEMVRIIEAAMPGDGH